jgi:PAS domain S-box-containing protein
MQRALSPEEYRLLVEKAPIMVWRADETMACDYFNEIWLHFTGRSLEQEVGNGWAEGVHPEDFDRCLAIYQRHFSARETFEMEYRLRRFDGVYRWIFDRGTPYTDGAGNFLGYIGSCIDVTERVEAQAALAKRQEAEVNSLKGLLPICCHCKRIRNDRDYWEQIETYISSHSEALFSHGFCPECAAKEREKLTAFLAGAAADEPSP